MRSLGSSQQASSLVLTGDTASTAGNGARPYTHRFMQQANQHRLFIIEGSATFAAAIVGILLLPDTPGKTRWLSAEENACSVTRLEEDSVNELQHESPLQGLFSALKDYKVWIFMFMQNMHFSAMSFNQFFPTIVKTL